MTPSYQASALTKKKFISPVLHQGSSSPKRMKLLASNSRVEVKKTLGSEGVEREGLKSDGAEASPAIVNKISSSLMKEKQLLQQQVEERRVKLRKLRMAKMYRVKVSSSTYWIDYKSEGYYGRYSLSYKLPPCNGEFQVMI